MAQDPVREGARDRGRPAKVRPSEVYGRAENFRGILDQVWDQLWPLLSKAQTDDDVTRAFHEGAHPYDQSFVPGQSELLLKILKESTFPKRPKSMQRFIADSVAALGVVTARRSRDICAQERATRGRAHHIIRYEFYIECSCGYQGHSKEHACPMCAAKILFPVTLGSNFF
jgi:hypothetical protein